MEKKLSLFEFSEQAENLKLKEMEDWLDDQLSKINSGTKEHEIVFLWSDKILKINWPIKKGLTISKKDKKGLPLF